MSPTLRRRGLTVAAATLAATLIAPIPAFAYDPPPTIDEISAPVPSAEQPGARITVEREIVCATSGTTEDIALENEPPANAALGIRNLHQWATGKGVTVAVIDSGVTPNVRLPRLQGGGDYVLGQDGLDDCDHHGTLVAGLIAAQPSDKDGFIGMAPDASILSIRQNSLRIEAAGSKTEGGGARLDTVAQAIVRSVDMGASVINLSVTACAPAKSLVDTTDIGAALKYAHQKNVAVVASAGNASEHCQTNPSYDAAHPNDPRNWEGVVGVSYPSYYAASGLLLSVGGLDTVGAPYAGTMAGPWVSVAAPATDIVSLDPASGASGGLTNAKVDNNGARALEGTSFAAAYVTGLLALLKELHPDEPVDDLYARILRTSITSSGDAAGKTGWGAIDPLAALTYELDTSWPANTHIESQDVAMPDVDNPNRAPMWIAGIIGSIAFIVVLLCLIASVTNRKQTQKDLLQ